uniref:Uncharacterized protein n=1 Tax=Glossina pallidipes TaxID=7398 RepID=A0A1B0AI40_GLOPL
MESKRSHTPSVHSNKPGSSKAQILKSTSDVSVTPSQAAELAKQNARKNPLDALSKMNARQTPIIERRSGLQDVDEEYLKKNIFTKPLFPRHSGLNDDVYAARQIQNMPAAGQPSVPGSNDDAYAARQLQIQNMPAAGQPSVPTTIYLVRGNDMNEMNAGVGGGQSMPSEVLPPAAAAAGAN